MEHTGIFATAGETKELLELLDIARNTPVIAMSVADGLAGRDFARLAWDDLKKKCHKTALDHGLPEFEGYYGMDTHGEFVRSLGDFPNEVG